MYGKAPLGPEKGSFMSRDRSNSPSTQSSGPLFSRSWPPHGQPRARVVVVHGYGEHCGRYEGLAAALTTTGIHVHAYDQRGHGNSPGERGIVGSIEDLAEDLGRFLDFCARQQPVVPIFLLGQSLGGLVLIHTLARRTDSFAGAIFCSPFLAVPPHIPRWKRHLAPLLGRFFPNLPVDRVNPSYISRIPEVVTAFETDPLVYHGPVRARTGAAIARGLDALPALLPNLELPLLVLHGTRDAIAPFAGSELLQECAASPDLTFRSVEDGYHELLQDIDSEDVIGYIVDWIEARC